MTAHQALAYVCRYIGVSLELTANSAAKRIIDTFAELKAENRRLLAERASDHRRETRIQAALGMRGVSVEEEQALDQIRREIPELTPFEARLVLFRTPKEKA